MSSIESEYLARMDALPGKDRVARAMELLHWTREMLARHIIAEQGAMSAERCKWEVALRLYGDDEGIRKLIEKKLADVSG